MEIGGIGDYTVINLSNIKSPYLKVAVKPLDTNGDGKVSLSEVLSRDISLVKKGSPEFADKIKKAVDVIKAFHKETQYELKKLEVSSRFLKKMCAYNRVETYILCFMGGLYIIPQRLANRSRYKLMKSKEKVLFAVFAALDASYKDGSFDYFAERARANLFKQVEAPNSFEVSYLQEVVQKVTEQLQGK